jgi:hypothetical protein
MIMLAPCSCRVKYAHNRCGGKDVAVSAAYRDSQSTQARRQSPRVQQFEEFKSIRAGSGSDAGVGAPKR